MDVLWITVPTVLIVAAYFTRKWYTARQLTVYGIGKGAPGFQTNVRKVRITPAIAARLQRGEEVSAEEIARAAAEAETPNALAGRGVVEEVQLGTNEWLPETLKKRSKGKKRR